MELPLPNLIEANVLYTTLPAEQRGLALLSTKLLEQWKHLCAGGKKESVDGELVVQVDGRCYPCAVNEFCVTHPESVIVMHHASDDNTLKSRVVSIHLMPPPMIIKNLCVEIVSAPSSVVRESVVQKLLRASGHLDLPLYNSQVLHLSDGYAVRIQSMDGHVYGRMDSKAACRVTTAGSDLQREIVKTAPPVNICANTTVFIQAELQKERYLGPAQPMVDAALLDKAILVALSKQPFDIGTKLAITVKDVPILITVQDVGIMDKVPDTQFRLLLTAKVKVTQNPSGEQLVLFHAVDRDDAPVKDLHVRICSGPPGVYDVNQLRDVVLPWARGRGNRLYDGLQFRLYHGDHVFDCCVMGSAGAADHSSHIKTCFRLANVGVGVVVHFLFEPLPLKDASNQIHVVTNTTKYVAKRVVVRLGNPLSFLTGDDEEAGEDVKKQVVDADALKTAIRKQFMLFRPSMIASQSEWKTMDEGQRRTLTHIFNGKVYFSLVSIGIDETTAKLTKEMYEEEVLDVPQKGGDPGKPRVVTVTRNGHKDLVQMIVIDDATQIDFVQDDNNTFELMSKQDRKKNKHQHVKVHIDLKTLPQRVRDMGIAGMEKVVDAVIRDVLVSKTALVTPQMRKLMKPSRGVLLYGPPGNGKTLLARGLGRLLGCREEHINMFSATEVFDKYVGESEKRVRTWFEPSRTAMKELGEKSPLYMLIIDEIDAMLPVRGSSNGSWRDTVVNQFLTEMDGLVQGDNLLVIGMTNRIDTMDPASLRPGRFGCKVEVPYPSKEQRLQIFNSYFMRLLEGSRAEEPTKKETPDKEEVSGVKVDEAAAPTVSPPHVDLFCPKFVSKSGKYLEKLATAAHEFSGADIEGLFNRAINMHLNSRLMEEPVPKQINFEMLKHLMQEVDQENKVSRKHQSSSAQVHHLSDIFQPFVFQQQEHHQSNKGDGAVP